MLQMQPVHTVWVGRCSNNELDKYDDWMQPVHTVWVGSNASTFKSYLTMMQPVHTVWVGRESAIHLSVILKMQPVQTYGLEVSIVVTSLLLIEDATRTYHLG